jgi:hypothetical protein
LPRYYFHLVDGPDVIPDRIGAEVVDLEEARAEVIKAIREFRQEQPAAVDGWEDYRIEVTDAWGVVVMTLSLSDGE